MSNFNPTHEFRGLELEKTHLQSLTHTWFKDADGRSYSFPYDVPTKLPEKPKPGEVWQYMPGEAWKYKLRHVGGLELVNSDGNFVDVDGTITQSTKSSHEHFTKVLNADGTPA